MLDCDNNPTLAAQRVGAAAILLLEKNVREIDFAPERSGMVPLVYIIDVFHGTVRSHGRTRVLKVSTFDMVHHLGTQSFSR